MQLSGDFEPGNLIMARQFWIVGGIALLLIAVALGMAQLILPRVLPLPVYATLPTMVMRDQDNRAFDLAQTRGQVVVLSILYTHCPDICPLTTTRLRGLQQRVEQAGWSKAVHFLSITIDPARDQPSTLKLFAQAREVDFSNWAFLTGTNDQTLTLIHTLGIYVERVYDLDGTPVSESSVSSSIPPNTAYTVNHTDRIFIIDQQGNVRALEPGSTADLERVMQWIGQLLNTPVKQ